MRSASRSGSRSQGRSQTTSPIPNPTAQFARPNRFRTQVQSRDASSTVIANTHATTDLNDPETEKGEYCDYHLIGVVAKLEVALNSIGQAYSEVAETKQGIFDVVSGYKDVYCEQIQKFSVLAYDYLERIDTLSKREKRIETEV